MNYDDRNDPESRSGDEHQGWYEDAAAYVIGGLDQAETERFLEHSESCSKCQSRLVWMQPAVDLIPAAVEQQTPSAGLRDRIMAEVHADLAETDVEAAAFETERDPSIRRQESSGRPGPIARFGEWLSGAMPSPAMGMAATIAIAVAIGGGYVIGNSGSDDAGGDKDPVVAVATTKSAAATVSVNGNSGTLNVEQLPVTSKDETYQIWVVRDGEVEPSATFSYSGKPVSAVIPQSLAGANQIVVTLEPAGGSQIPQGPKFLSAELQ